MENEEEQMCTFNVIDTPGLMEILPYNADEETRSDNQVIQLVSTAIQNEITKINVLVICTSIWDSISHDDETVFAIIFEKFYHPHLKIIICNTRADKRSKDDDSEDSK